MPDSKQVKELRDKIARQPTEIRELLEEILKQLLEKK